MKVADKFSRNQQQNKMQNKAETGYKFTLWLILCARIDNIRIGVSAPKKKTLQNMVKR